MIIAFCACILLFICFWFLWSYESHCQLTRFIKFTIGNLFRIFFTVAINTCISFLISMSTIFVWWQLCSNLGPNLEWWILNSGYHYSTSISFFASFRLFCVLLKFRMCADYRHFNFLATIDETRWLAFSNLGRYLGIIWVASCCSSRRSLSSRRRTTLYWLQSELKWCSWKILIIRQCYT